MACNPGSTHHHACDCREALFQRLEQQNKLLRKQRDEACEILDGIFDTFNEVTPKMEFSETPKWFDRLWIDVQMRLSSLAESWERMRDE